MALMEEIDSKSSTSPPTLFALITRIYETSPETEMNDLDAAATWVDPLDKLLYALDIVVPVMAGIFGLILLGLIFGVKALRNCKLCWHMVSIVLAVWIKALIVIPLAYVAEFDQRGWIYGKSMCHGFYLLDYLQKTVVALSLLWVCIDRLWFCYRPDVYATYMSSALAGSAVAIIWGLGLACSATLNYAWGGPRLITLSSGGGGIVAGGSNEAYNHSICDVEPSDDNMRDKFIEIGIYVVPTVLCLILLFVSFGACCTRRRLFYEDRWPIAHAIILVTILVILYGTLTLVRVFSFFPYSTVLLHAGEFLRLLRILLISEKVFYALVLVVLLIFVQEVREGIRVLYKSCCPQDAVNERTMLMRPM